MNGVNEDINWKPVLKFQRPLTSGCSLALCCPVVSLNINYIPCSTLNIINFQQQSLLLNRKRVLRWKFNNEKFKGSVCWDLGLKLLLGIVNIIVRGFYLTYLYVIDSVKVYIHELNLKLSMKMNLNLLRLLSIAVPPPYRSHHICSWVEAVCMPSRLIKNRLLIRSGTRGYFKISWDCWPLLTNLSLSPIRFQNATCSLAYH